MSQDGSEEEHLSTHRNIGTFLVKDEFGTGRAVGCNSCCRSVELSDGNVILSLLVIWDNNDTF
jgi:hypothetical protein